MPGYLLDTNHVGAWFDKTPAFLSRLNAARPEDLFFICSISLGEIEASYFITERDLDVARAFARFVREKFLSGQDGNNFVLCIDERSRERYAEVVSRIWKRNPPPPSGRRRTEAHLVGLGVDINDVWIFSTAWMHRLILLTTDRMDPIRSAVPEVRVENWLEPGGPKSTTR